MKRLVPLPFVAAGALFTCLAACVDPMGVDPSATASTGAPATTGTSTPGATTDGTDPLTPTSETPDTAGSTAHPTTTVGDTTPSVGTTSTGATSTGTTATESTSTGETDTGLGPCQVADETAGGPVDWARQFKYTSLPHQLAVGPSGTIAIAQTFYQTELDFGGGPMQADYQDGYLALFDPQGVHLASVHLDALEGDITGEVSTVRLAMGPAGEVYIAGGFSGELAIGGESIVAPYGIDGDGRYIWATYDVMLIKFAPDGAVLWSKNWGDELSQEAFALAVAPGGNVVIGGPNKGVVDFGGGPLGVGGGQTTGFVAEFTPDGEHVASRSFGPPYAFPVIFSIDPAGRLAMAGSAGSGVDLGGGPLPDGSDDMFLAQFDAQGVHRWSRRFLPHHSIGRIVADAAGAVIVTGQEVGPNALYVLRLAADDGALAWKKVGIGDVSASGMSLALDPAGNAVVGGWFYETIDLGEGPLGSGGGTIFAAYDAAGALQWHRLLGDPLREGPWALAYGPEGELVFTSFITECTDLGTGPLEPPPFAEDLLLARIAP